jgi:hypothetical protein
VRFDRVHYCNAHAKKLPLWPKLDEAARIKARDARAGLDGQSGNAI